MHEEDTAYVQGSEVVEGGKAMLGSLDVALLVGLVAVVVALVWTRWRRMWGREERVRKLSISPTLLGRQIQEEGGALEGTFIARMKSRKKKVIVFYGSQMGTAEEFSSRLAKEATRHGLPAMTFDPEECTDWGELSKLGEEIENSLAIFCVATYGEGDPTDNAQEFHEWLKAGEEDLSGLTYTVFGLGNKTYEHFNAMGRFVDGQLFKMGAEKIYPRGEGDDDGNIEEDFVTWKEGLWPIVCQYFGIDTSQETGVTREYNLTFNNNLPPEKVFTGEPHRLGSFRNQKGPYNIKNPFLAPITVLRELHTGGDRSCMHIEMGTTGSRLSYVAGDHVAIYPVNDPKLVERIGELLSVDLGTTFTLTNVDEQASKKHPFPCPTTYCTALSHYVDITSSPRTNVLRELAEYASDPKERDFLLLISSATDEGKHKYSEWIVHDKRTIVAVLEDLPSFKPPLDYLLELLPHLQPRYYSISSSPRMYPNSIHITAVLVEYKTRTGRTNRGVTTYWLKRLQHQMQNGGPVPRVPIHVRHSSLRLPYRPICPIILVGPGTGLAPFRGFIQDRKAIKDEGKKVGETVLFFGCRREKEDYIYREELLQYQENEVLSELNVAFSRDQPEKVYVQHKMKEKASKIWSLLENQGYFYVCGDARNMARDVHNTLLQIFQDEGGMDSSTASEYMKKLHKRGRFLQDVWS